MGAGATVTRLGTLPEPWTRGTRPPLLGKPQPGFPQRPQGIFSSNLMRGHFYCVKDGDISISL
jgi:hypothetical protein